MRPRLAVVSAAVAGLLVGGLAVTGASAATANDTECRKVAAAAQPASGVNSAEVLAYDACRFDKLDGAIKALGVTTPVPSPSPSVTSSSTASASTSPTPSATPSPTPTATPSSTAFPDASSTGVPSGVVLSNYTGPLTITTANTVIDAKSINGDLVIKASGVKISRSQIDGIVSTDENSTGYSFSITDSDVNAGNRPATGVGAVNFTAIRVDVTGGNRSMNCWKDCMIIDSYVHGQFTDATGKAHESGIRMGARGIVRHNTVACTAPDVAPDAGCSAALTGYGDFATVENMTIDNNLFIAGSGGFCAYGGSSAGKPYPNAHDIKFTNNVWQRGTQKSDHGTYICGYYGPVTAFNSSAPGNVWSNNKFDDGATVQSSN